MPVETNSKQNIIIWSICSFVILILCGIIGWLINGKDTALTASINNLVIANNTAIEKSEKSDAETLKAFNKLCDRVGTVEGRVGNLEIYIQMPFNERERYIFKQKNNK